MRLVLYSMATDRRKAHGIANIGPNGVLNAFSDTAQAPNVALQMEFERTHPTRPRYRLTQGTRMAIALTVGLLQSVDELVIVMHAGPGMLAVDGGTTGTATLASGAWSLDDAGLLIHGLEPTAVYFLCCNFGRPRLDDLVPGYRVADGPGYLAALTRATMTMHAMNEAAMAAMGMPVLTTGFYQRHVPGTL
ncbi:hypothetical protein [Aquabacterium humicola]|uniref:hypothetical protein n=1 Tax=Aquabacterium humicola TaxID=3237377 RepID=UPI0025430C99|nr:hypothetical protein [Rubrivivax pictus]